MRQVSQEFRNAVQRNTNVAVKATLALADGTELDLVNSDFVIGSVSFDEATSSTGSFDIGSAIVGQFKATIANYDGKFSRYDFSGSTITPSVGTVVNGTMEWLQIGVYDIDRPTSTGRSIEIQAYDKLNSMKVALNTVDISYPTTLGDIALKLCDACGVTLESSAFPNNDYQVKDAPKLVDSDTCLSGIAWVAQIACCYVKCSNLGHIVLDWYDPADFNDAANLDGGTFDAGGSANVLEGVSPKLLNGTTYDGSALVTPARTSTKNTPTYYIEWPLSQPAASTNQTYRVVMSCIGDGGSGYLTAHIAYKDAAGNTSAADAAIAYSTEWAYAEATLVVPSGMTPVSLSICKWGQQPSVSMANAELWQGGNVSYSDGDTADGGTFDDYSSGAKVDAGEFSNRRFWVLARNQQSKVSTDDVTITGVSVTAQDEETSDGSIAEKGETALSGKAGYVLSISGNKFVSFGTAQRVADLIAPNVVGLKFRTFSASTLGNPVIECGDAVYVTDYTANAYRSYITQLTYTVGSYESVACNAETPTHNAAINASAATKTLQETRSLVANERSSREAALSRLSNQISEKAGLYQTVETLGDGSKVFYLHDAETVGRSKTIWKMNAQAIAVSVDGGKSYVTGITADGNAILNRIYAVGINADYINTGTITVNDSSGNPILKLGEGADTGLSVKNPFTGNGFVSLSKYAFAQPVFASTHQLPELTTTIKIDPSEASSFYTQSELNTLLSGKSQSKSVSNVIYKDFTTTDSGYVVIDVTAVCSGAASGRFRTYDKGYTKTSSSCGIYSNSTTELTVSVTEQINGVVRETKKLKLMSGTAATSDGTGSETDLGDTPQNTRLFMHLDMNENFRVSIDASVSTTLTGFVNDEYIQFVNRYHATHTVQDVSILVTPCGT